MSAPGTVLREESPDPTIRRAKTHLERVSRTGKRIEFMVFPDEYETIVNRAKSAGKTISAYLRECALRVPHPISTNQSSGESSALPLPKHSQKEFLGNARNLKDARVEKKIENISLPMEEKLSADVAKRIGHRVSCACFACERLRKMMERPAEKKSKRKKK